MHHPGPPRFDAVGSTIELAPREPDTDGTYEWEIVESPADSSVSLGPGAVLDFTPDRPGRYELGLTAPDGHHRLTVRAFPASYTPPSTAPDSGESGHRSGSGLGNRSGYQSGSKRGSGTASARDGDHGRPRVTLSGHVEGDDLCLTADVSPAPNSGRSETDIDVEFYADDRDEATTEDLAVSGQRARIPLAAVGEFSRFHAVAVTDSFSVPDAVAVERGQDVTIDHLTAVPEWAKDQTVYEVYMRTFSGNGTPGFQAVQDKLDYLDRLGVDTLWLTPVLENDEFDHGYNITDFFSVADDLGTREEFEALVDSAHEKGMKVLFDLVLNHSAREHEFFKRAEDGDPAYRDWYEWDDEDTDTPATYFDWPYIANFNFENLEVRRHLLDVVDEWASLVDGFRCDMAWAVPTSFWMEVRERVKRRDDEFLLLDETIPYIADFHGRCFDVHFDTTLYHNLREVGNDRMAASAVPDAIENRARTGFPDHAGFLLYLENHDETRYAEDSGRDQALAAAGATFTLPGIPLIYAGQEVGEPTRRDDIDWDQSDETLRAHYQSLVQTREEHPALGYEGTFEEIETAADHERVVAYAREHDGNRFVVVLNFAESSRAVSVPGERVDTRNLLDDATIDAPDGDVIVDDVAILEATQTEREHDT